MAIALFVSVCSDSLAKQERADGTNYPPKTIYQILCGLLCYSRENQSDPINFLDRKDT